MRRRMWLPMAAAWAGLAAAAPAQTPAERAGRLLDRDIAGDRARDAATAAREADVAPSLPNPQVSPGARQLEADRATIRPDVGRPETTGAASGTLRGTGEDRNVTR